MSRPKEMAGFTLVELMVVVAIIAIMASIGFPSFRSMLLDNRLSNTTNTLLGALQLARSEAVMQKTSISACAANSDRNACANGTDWSNGAIISRGTAIIRVIAPVSGDITVTSSASSITYAADGTTTAATITISDARPASRQISINAIGQACSGSGC
ncbi:GspH/FimT family pseudopilin [Pseudomonas citronellolis]|uniref:GspH/FimT family pseudopilin n=1 Tax=Pseudomonas citronellolis TaxID=53408 RepID=UPI0023E3695A|nr:GspH/FimT family pseudopilin [Pseudomonas citronellolis]MDF3931081.1 GspH/FimT family pseudopilin [Pseudomonas citronellolis]